MRPARVGNVDDFAAIGFPRFYPIIGSPMSEDLIHPVRSMLEVRATACATGRNVARLCDATNRPIFT
jgi:hypothetical protein